MFTNSKSLESGTFKIMYQNECPTLKNDLENNLEYTLIYNSDYNTIVTITIVTIVTITPVLLLHVKQKPFPGVETIRMNFKYQFVKFWNDAPDHIKSSEILPILKKSFMTELLFFSLFININNLLILLL